MVKVVKRDQKAFEHSQKLYMGRRNILSFSSLPTDDDDGPGPCAPGLLPPSQEDDASYQEFRQIVREVLPPRYSQVVLLFLDGHPPREIASELGESSEVIRARLSRARRRLGQHRRVVEYWSGYAA